MVGRLAWTAFTAWHLRHESTLPFQPLERTLALQSRRIRGILEHAYETVPFYKEAMRRFGLRPQDFRSAEDLAQLPLVTRDQLADEIDRFRSSRYRDLMAIELTSAGTTGRRKTIGYDKRAMFLTLASGHRQRVVLRSFTHTNSGYREAVLIGPGGLQSQFRNYIEKNSWIPRRAELNRIYVAPCPDFEGALDQLNQFRPQVVRGFGSSMAAFLLWVAEKGKPMARPAAFVYGGEPMTSEERSFIEREFGAPVLSTYQSTESMRIGYECQQRCGFHISLDYAALRIAGPSGEAVPADETGEVIVSNLVNRATVLLNFRTGDLARLSSDVCPCGRTLPLLRQLDGRTDDMIRREDGAMFHISQVVPALLKLPGVLRMQVIQEDPRRFVISVQSLMGADRADVESRMVQSFRGIVGAEAEVRVAFPESLIVEPSGKVRLVISHVARPQGLV